MEKHQIRKIVITSIVGLILISVFAVAKIEYDKSKSQETYQSQPQNEEQTGMPTIAGDPNKKQASAGSCGVLEEKYCQTAQFPVFDKEAMTEKMDLKEIGASLNFPVVMFYPTSEPDKRVPIFAPYDGAAQVVTFGDASHSETVIQFAKVDGVWDGNWDTEKFYQPSAFPISVSAEKITPAVSISPGAIAVKKGEIVGYLESFTIKKAEFVKNPGPLAVSIPNSVDVYLSLKEENKPSLFLEESLIKNR